MILEGIRKTGKSNYEVIPDREKAIKHIIGMAEEGDAVLLAGKGHETYQIIRDRRIDLFSFSFSSAIN